MKKKNKLVINIDGLSLLEKAANLTISYDDENEVLCMKPMFNKDVNVDLDYKKFTMFLNAHPDPNNVAYLGTKRFLEKEQIEMIEMGKTDNNVDYMQISGHSDRYLNIVDLNTIIYNDVLVNHLWKKIGKDFASEYTINKNKIDNICIYDSKMTTQFKYVDRDKTLYITNNYENMFSSVETLIVRIVADFNKDKTPKNYLVNEDKIVLEYDNNKSITIHNKKYVDKYKNTIEKFQNDLIEVKRKVYKKERDDKYGYGKNG